MMRENLQSIRNPIKVLLFGSIFNSTLWYLYALIWTLVIMNVVYKYLSKKWIYYSIIILLFIHITGRMYLQKHWDINNYVYLFRSAILFGVPFVLLGNLIARYANKIRTRITFKKSIIILCIGVMVQMCEFLKWRQYMDLQFSTIIIAGALFWIASEYWTKDYLPMIRIIGKKYSVWIYILHLPIANLIDFFVLEAAGRVYLYIRPFVVIIISCVCAIIIVKIEKIHYKKRSCNPNAKRT